MWETHAGREPVDPRRQSAPVALLLTPVPGAAAQGAHGRAVTPVPQAGAEPSPALTHPTGLHEAGAVQSGDGWLCGVRSQVSVATMTDHEHLLDLLLQLRPPMTRLARQLHPLLLLLGGRPLARRAPVHRGRRTPAAPASRPPRPRALHDLSEPAQFGLRDQTLLDTTVHHWRDQRRPAQPSTGGPAPSPPRSRRSRRLGVERLDALAAQPADLRPRPVLPNRTRTPEKHPGMVATLVLVWPSPHWRDAAELQLGQQKPPCRHSICRQGSPLVRVLCRLSSRGAASAGGLARRVDLRSGAARRTARPAVPAGLQTAWNTVAAAVRAGQRRAGHGALGAAAGP